MEEDRSVRGVYEQQWLAAIESVDWVGSMFGHRPHILELDRATWTAWETGFAEAISELDPGGFLTIVAPPLDRPFPRRPAESRWQRLRNRGRYWPRNPDAKIRRVGFDERLVPRVQVFRHQATLSASTPASVVQDGWFPWTKRESAILLAAGWAQASDPPFENVDDLHWSEGRGRSSRTALSLSDRAERPSMAKEVCALTVALFSRVLGLPDPSLMQVIKRR